MSELMANACKEARKGNKTLKESVRHIGNKFLNASEVSAQEAAYLILQLRMSEKKSRKCEFIQTAPQEERTFLLKSKKELTELPEESTDIKADNIIKRYSRRPKVLETYSRLIMSQKWFPFQKTKYPTTLNTFQRQVAQTTIWT